MKSDQMHICFILQFIFKLNCRSHVTRNVVFFSEDIDRDVHFDIIAVSPMSGLNRTDDNILLYISPKHYKKNTAF